MVATEQYPNGLGSTHESLRLGLEATGAAVVEKPTFSGWAHPAVRNALAKLGRPQVVVAGIEAHVCVLQTVLDLQEAGFHCFLCSDAISANQQGQIAPALRRMERAGAVSAGVLSVMYELIGDAAHPAFRSLLELAKEIRQ